MKTFPYIVNSTTIKRGDVFNNSIYNALNNVEDVLNASDSQSYIGTEQGKAKSWDCLVPTLRRLISLFPYQERQEVRRQSVLWKKVKSIGDKIVILQTCIDDCDCPNTALCEPCQTRCIQIRDLKSALQRYQSELGLPPSYEDDE